MFEPDPWLVLQCIALCFVTSLVLGLLPAIRFSRPAIITALKSGSAGSGQRVGRLQRFTAAAQAGLAVPFLVICGVYLDQARTTAFADVGFTPKGLYAARLGPAAVAKTEEEQRLFVRTVSAEPGAGAGRHVGERRRWRAAGLRSIATCASRASGDGAFVPAHTTRVGRGIWTRSARV